MSSKRCLVEISACLFFVVFSKKCLLEVVIFSWIHWILAGFVTPIFVLTRVSENIKICLHYTLNAYTPCNIKDTLDKIEIEFKVVVYI